ncbi:MAG: hypothetical protein EOP05_00980 [Proteobacteria bacterium]|nr:MAG: hypothetical protein EOP05_00980 [Pseudomonadota bacterium]
MRNPMNLKTLMITTLLAFTLAPTANARWKDTSGGNGVGGTLLDQFERGQSEPLPGEDVLKAVHAVYGARLADLPLLQRYLEEISTKRKAHLAWFLEDRKLSKECFNQSALDLPDQKILACQNDVEVRINRAFWLSATPEQKANLIVHELFTSMALERGVTRGIREATTAFLDGSKSTRQVGDSLANAGFPFLPTRQETQETLSLMAETEKQTCSLKNQQQILVRVADLVATFQTSTGVEASALAVPAIDLQLNEQKSYGCKTSVIKPHFELLFAAWKTLVATP